MKQTDHPRMGGEKVDVWAVMYSRKGSPPHGRGKVFFQHRHAAGKGITPAWAGKRRPQPRYQPPCRDHPRMGGEKTKKIP